MEANAVELINGSPRSAVDVARTAFAGIGARRHIILTDPDGRGAYGAKRFVRPVYDAAMAGAAKRVAAGKDPQPAVLTQLGQWVKRRAA